jgi:hypothetical protein
MVDDYAGSRTSRFWLIGQARATHRPPGLKRMFAVNRDIMIAPRR